MENTNKNSQDRLEEALLSYIERTVSKPSPEAEELAVIPAMGQVLAKLWGFH